MASMQVWKSVTANTSQCFSLSPLSPLFQLGTPLPRVNSNSVHKDCIKVKVKNDFQIQQKSKRILVWTLKHTFQKRTYVTLNIELDANFLFYWLSRKATKWWSWVQAELEKDL